MLTPLPSNPNIYYSWLERGQLRLIFQRIDQKDADSDSTYIFQNPLYPMLNVPIKPSNLQFLTIHGADEKDTNQFELAQTKGMDTGLNWGNAGFGPRSMSLWPGTSNLP